MEELLGEEEWMVERKKIGPRFQLSECILSYINLWHKEERDNTLKVAESEKIYHQTSVFSWRGGWNSNDGDNDSKHLEP